MKFRKKWEKQNNSVKLLLRKLKRHDTLVVAIAVVIALLLCGGLIYISTPVVTANAKEEFEESEKAGKEETKEKLDELHDYLTELDKSITDSREGLDSFIETSREENESETITERVTAIDRNLKELHDSVTLTDTQLQSLNELIEKNNSESTQKLTDEFGKVSERLSSIQSEYEQAQSENKTLINEVKELIKSENSKQSKELEEKLDAISKKLDDMDAGFKQDIEKLIAETDRRFNEMLEHADSKFSELNSNTENRFSELNSNTENRFNELNQNITNNFELSKASSNDGLKEIREFIAGEINGLNGKLEQVFQRVSDGKKLLASALLTKGVTVAEDATFKEFSDAIKSIPQQIVLGNGDVAGKVEYEYHYHVDGNGTECDERCLPEERKGGCYMEPVYHRHTDSCYSTTYVYYYDTNRNTERLHPVFESNGETFFKFHCNYCGQDYISANSYHGESTSDIGVVSQRHGIILRTETNRRLNCPYSDGQLLGYRPSCGFVHGQIVKAHITFGQEYKDYESTVDVPRGNPDNIVTSNLMMISPDISALLNEFDYEDEPEHNSENNVESPQESTDEPAAEASDKAMEVMPDEHGKNDGNKDKEDVRRQSDDAGKGSSDSESTDESASADTGADTDEKTNKEKDDNKEKASEPGQDLGETQADELTSGSDDCSEAS